MVEFDKNDKAFYEFQVTIDEKNYRYKFFNRKDKIVIKAFDDTYNDKTGNEKKHFVYLIKSIINRKEFLEQLKLQFNSISKYINNGEIVKPDILLEELKQYPNEKCNISVDGFCPKFLLLAYYYEDSKQQKKKYMEALELYIKFLENIDFYPDFTPKTKEFRNKEHYNEEFEPNQLITRIIINEKLVLYVLQGCFSNFDMLLKYSEYDKGKWSRKRAPKHIHWAVDLIIKKQLEEELTNEFLDELIKVWDEKKPFMNNEQRNRVIKNVIDGAYKIEQRFSSLENIGEYPVKFLWVLAELLMYQEKSNNADAYMFKKLLCSLRNDLEIYKVVSIATHR
jgi:hypothetical protein